MDNDLRGPTLGEVVSLVRGTTYKSALLGQPGPVLLGLASIERNGGFRADSLKTYGGDSPSKLLLFPGDLYVSLKDVTQSGDLLGAIARVPKSIKTGRLTQDTVKLDFGESKYPRNLLYWALRTPQYRAYCRAHATGTTNLGLGREDFLAYRLPAATKEALCLVAVLDALDEKIELNRKQNETLEAMARALFKAWFVDFEPVRAKMEGRWQRGQSLPGLPAHLYDLFPDRLVASELGEIPEGWGVGKLGDVAVNPRRSVQPNQIGEGTPYIALEHMPKRCIALAEWGMADGLESNKYEFKRGEILFGKLRPYFHKVGLAPVDGVCSTDIVVIAPKLPMWFGFVLAHASSDVFVEYTNAGSTGTKMPRTNWTDMARYAVAMPTDDVATAFNLHIHAISEEIIARIHESKSLAQLRDTLLPKLISGELRIRDAEAFLKGRG